MYSILSERYIAESGTLFSNDLTKVTKNTNQEI